MGLLKLSLLQVADFMNDESCLEAMCKQAAKWLLERDSADPQESGKLHVDRARVCTEGSFNLSDKALQFCQWTCHNKHFHNQDTFDT